jgi:hypothetical protein
MVTQSCSFWLKIRTKASQSEKGNIRGGKTELQCVIAQEVSLIHLLTVATELHVEILIHSTSLWEEASDAQFHPVARKYPKSFMF